MTSSKLERKKEPKGVIDTLSAGISVVASYPWLLLLPVLFDLFLWVGPPLTLEPTWVEAVIAPFDPQGPYAAEMSQALAGDLETFYEALQTQLRGFNLWTFLIPPVLFWPTVLAPGTVDAAGSAVQIGGLGSVLLVALGFSVVGVWLNMVWLGLVARGLRNKPLFAAPGRLLVQALRHATRFISVLLLLLVTILVILVPLSIIVALVGLMLPGVGQLLASFLSLGGTWAVLWLGLHFYFTAGAIVLDDEGIIQSLGNSVRVVRRFFWSAFGFIALSLLLSSGFQLIWAQLSALSPAGRATSVIGNAALGTAIAAAMFIFYRERVGQVRQPELGKKNKD